MGESETLEYEPTNISWYKGQWYHYFKITNRPDFISSIMMRSPHKYVVDVILKYGRYVKGKVMNDQQLIFFEDDEDNDVGVAALEQPHNMEIIITTSHTDSKISLLITGYSRDAIDGIDALKVFYQDPESNKHTAYYKYSLHYDSKDPPPTHPSLPFELLNHPFVDADSYRFQILPYKTFEEENKVVVYLNELADVYRKFYIYIPKYTPPNYVADRKAKMQGGRVLKKYIHIYRFICNNEIISEFNHGRVMTTEEPDLYEMQFFMTEDGKPINIPCNLAPATRYRIEIEFSEAVPSVKQLAVFAELGDYTDSAIRAVYNTQQTQFKMRASTPVELCLRGGLITFNFLLPYLNKGKSKYA